MSPGLDLLLVTEEDSPTEFRGLEARRILGGQARMGAFPHPPHLGVTLLGTIARNQGFSCEVIDNVLRLPERRQRFEDLLRQRPLLVGVSTTLILNEGTLRDIVERVRSLSPQSILILGGPTMVEQPELREYGDICALLEGERSLLGTLRTLKAGGDLSQVPGILFKKDGQWIENPKSPLVEYSEIPFPDWGMLGRDPGEMYLLETQRGCVYKCRFCTYPIYSPGTPGGNGLRLKHIERVIDEMRYNYYRFGISNYIIADSTFTFPVQRAKDLCRAIIQSKLPVRWHCYGRVDNLDPELSSLMVEAGCRSILFGVESGDAEMLLRIRKDFTPEDIHRGVALARRFGIQTLCSFLVGFPGETEASVATTEKRILDIGTTMFTATTFTLDHNSPIWALREQYALEGKGLRWKHRTMDSHQAHALVLRMIKNILVRNGPRLGSNYIAYCMGAGLTYEEALRFNLDRGLLVAWNLAKSENAPLSAFDSNEVAQAQRRYQSTVLRIAARNRRLLIETPAGRPTKAWGDFSPAV